MKTLCFTFSAALLLSLSAASQTAMTTTPRPAAPAKPSATLTSAQEEMTGLLQQIATAIEKRDTVFLARHYATEYRHYTPDGPTNRTNELLFISSKEFPFSTATLATPVEATNYGTTAVTVTTMKFGGKDKNNKAFTSDLQMMAVWVQRDGRWQMAVVHSRELPPKKTAKG
jgi:hypothetical protein